LEGSTNEGINSVIVIVIIAVEVFCLVVDMLLCSVSYNTLCCYFGVPFPFFFLIFFFLSTLSLFSHCSADEITGAYIYEETYITMHAPEVRST